MPYTSKDMSIACCRAINMCNVLYHSFHWVGGVVRCLTQKPHCTLKIPKIIEPEKEPYSFDGIKWNANYIPIVNRTLQLCLFDHKC